jgi:hypothetical protein
MTVHYVPLESWIARCMQRANVQMRIPAASTMHVEFDFQIKIAPTDGTRLPGAANSVRRRFF